MSNDLEILQELQQAIGIELVELEGDIQTNRHAYELDSEQSVVGLHLQNTGLTEFPRVVLQLKNLQTLDLDANKIDSLPPELAQLQNLTTLTLWNTCLTEFPRVVLQLKNLQALDLGVNNIDSLPPELAQLQNLKDLSINSIALTEFPHVALQLKNLQILDLGANKIDSLPPELAQLQNLKDLRVNSIGLSEFPRMVLQLKNLQALYLGGNEIHSLPPELAQLQNLKDLSLYRIGLPEFPRVVLQLKNLQTLYLAGNKIDSLPPELAQLQNLKDLSLYSIGLSEFPRVVLQLKNLQTLDLGRNTIDSLPTELAQLQNLKALRLIGNSLTELPQEMVLLRKLERLELSMNPLEDPPPEIVEQGIDAIFEYLRQLSTAVEVQNEAKLILVGQGDVGKTCLAKRLIFDTFQRDKSTEGVDILKWNISAPTDGADEIKLNVWDFGGQEIYHATHQFFLTKRSVYLLVWNARKTKDYEHIYYWLHTIEAFGDDSPVILVMTKWNERDNDLNMKDLRERFPQVQAALKVENEDGRGILELRDLICQTAWRLPHMRTPWIESWFKVRDRLESSGLNWVPHDEFKRICEGEGLDEKQTDILGEYLHDLGAVIHFRENVKLRNIVILKPDWGTKAVYKVLDTLSVRERGGVLLHSELPEIWDPEIYPEDLHANLLELMNTFELASELPDKKSHLVAELLPSTEPDLDWDDSDNLYFSDRYDFLPAGGITRFIVLMHSFLEKKADGSHLCWREGAVLNWENTRVFVRVRNVEKVIDIRIHGRKKRELLAAIRLQFDHINRSIRKVRFTQEIPCNCSPACPHKFNYENLIKAEWNGRKEVQCQEQFIDIPLSALLDGYQTSAERQRHFTEEDLKESREERPISMHFGDNVNLVMQSSGVEIEAG